MFMGEYHHNIDAKNRLVIPSEFRSLLGTNFIVTRGIENCLYIYTLNEWQNLITKLSTIPFTKSSARIFNRSFFSTAASCTLDRQGRINISSTQISHASIIKECVIIGANEHLEIWAKEAWDKFNEEYSTTLSDIAEHLFNEV